jgi:hypothetical protein
MSANLKRGKYRRPGPWLQDLLRLAGSGLSDGETAAELNRLYPVMTPFTRWCVFYYRHQMDDADDDDMRRVDRHAMDRQAYQAKNGFGHLLPDPTLYAREVDVLALLRREGPLTGRQIARALGLRRLQAGRPPYPCHLRRLYLLGLVGKRACPPPRLTVYLLSPLALPPVPTGERGTPEPAAPRVCHWRG